MKEIPFLLPKRGVSIAGEHIQNVVCFIEGGVGGSLQVLGPPAPFFFFFFFVGGGGGACARNQDLIIRANFHKTLCHKVGLGSWIEVKGPKLEWGQTPTLTNLINCKILGLLR